MRCSWKLLNTNAPKWWRMGRPTAVLGSVPEVELLSQLAVLLMPRVPIAELFRSFPLKKSPTWARHSVSPDLSAYGVLKRREAALFVEYDGYYRHFTPEGVSRDRRKTAALLHYAPAGSLVLRVAHEHRDLRDDSVQIIIDTWQQGNETSVARALQQLLRHFLAESTARVCPEVCTRLERSVEYSSVSSTATDFAKSAKIVGTSENRLQELETFLREDVGANLSQQDEILRSRRYSIVQSRVTTLRRKLDWLGGLGLTPQQVTKAVTMHPGILLYNIEANLELTLAWFHEIGLSRSQSAHIVATYPKIFGSSLEEKLKPTAAWLRNLGLSQAEVAKVFARFPRVVSCSIGSKMDHAAAWLCRLGLSPSELAQVVARHPQLLGYSVESNLKPKKLLLQSYFTSAEICRMLSKFPPLFSYSYERLRGRLLILEEVGQLDGLISILTLTDERLAQRFPLHFAQTQ